MSADRHLLSTASGEVLGGEVLGGELLGDEVLGKTVHDSSLLVWHSCHWFGGEANWPRVS